MALIAVSSTHLIADVVSGDKGSEDDVNNSEGRKFVNDESGNDICDEEEGVRSK